MIENPLPETWQDLQSGVSRIFNEIGLAAEVGKSLTTPRGNVEVDVYAVDYNSVDKIRYVVECKNWKASIPQSVVHAFTTVMHEVGGNLGFIISREGLQSGATAYTQNTNILGLTYEEFQKRYFNVWYEKYFVTQIGNSAEPLVNYIEPFDDRRDKIVSMMTKEGKEEYERLLNKYLHFGICIGFFEFPMYSNSFRQGVPSDINEFKISMNRKTDGLIDLKSIYFRDAIVEILDRINFATAEFNSLFGCNIFSD